MKKYVKIILYILTIPLGFLISACGSELQDTISTPAGVSIHPAGISNPASDDFHGNIIKSNNWSMEDCKSCHGAQFTGGVNAANCLSCHRQPQGPLACNTCHGVFADPTKIYPPRDLSGNATSDKVGAHAVHLEGLGAGKALACNECHTVPATFDAAGHIDSTAGAELMFGVNSRISTNTTTSTYRTATLPVYTPNPVFGNITVGGATVKGCSDTYCHGTFKNGNTTNQVAWNAGPDGAKCGSCHGDPATGNPMPKTTAQGGSHPPVAQCNSCHGDVVSVSGTTYTIIDKNKHINGKLNVYNQEVNF